MSADRGRACIISFVPRNQRDDMSADKGRACIIISFVPRSQRDDMSADKDRACIIISLSGRQRQGLHHDLLGGAVPSCQRRFSGFKSLRKKLLADGNPAVRPLPW